jgi:hypothetical protein
MMLLIALAVYINVTTDHMDVVMAFLLGDLSETVYMRTLEGNEEKGKEDFVCLLQKTLCDLKQASKAWYNKMSEVLFLLALKRSVNEPCVVLRKGNLIIALYVDQAVIFANDESEKLSVKNELMSRFEMKNLGKGQKVL